MQKRSHAPPHPLGALGIPELLRLHRWPALFLVSTSPHIRVGATTGCCRKQLPQARETKRYRPWSLPLQHYGHMLGGLL